MDGAGSSPGGCEPPAPESREPRARRLCAIGVATTTPIAHRAPPRRKGIVVDGPLSTLERGRWPIDHAAWPRPADAAGPAAGRARPAAGRAGQAAGRATRSGGEE